ncbi:MAG: response regulator [Lachnospiraceae bacterium]|nr:response regulator [Lachnospiraceae bacterium]
MFDNYSIPQKTYFEIASLGYLAVLYLISFHDPNREKIRSYKLFRYLEVNMLLALIVSVLTYTFAYPELGTPIPVCTILRTMDSIMCVMASRIFAVYLLAYVDTDGRLKPVMRIGNILIGTYLLLMLLNLPFKFILWYAPDGTYLHGSLFVPIVFTSPVYYLTSCISVLLFRMKFLGARERVALSIASFVTLFGVIIQAATDGIVLLSLPFGSVGIFILYFSLETADYHQLIKNNEKLRLAEQDAIKANRAKSDFLANMSHEIRTPLNAVLGMDELILLETEPGKETDPALIGRIREYAGNIRDAGQVLLSVINDILDLSKIESGKMEIKPGPYQLRTLIGDVHTMVRVRAEQKGLSYVQKIDPGVPDRLVGDELRIRQIMINLLNNAVKYTEAGEVEMEISMQDLTDSSLTLCICVRDTGIGIRREDLPRIFGDFQRLDEKNNHRIEGTGLGLSIVKRMIELMYGDISVSSEYGRGSVFTVQIPQEINRAPEEEAPSEDAAAASEANAFTTPDCCYLVVDDNSLNLLVANHFLDGLKGRVETARSGEEALQKMRQEKYDMIFMDHMMPELDGIETYERSRKDPDNLNLDTPVIMMTANALNGMREEYLDRGFTDYISKPVEIEELFKIVRRHLPPEKVQEAIS